MGGLCDLTRGIPPPPASGPRSWRQWARSILRRSPCFGYTVQFRLIRQSRVTEAPVGPKFGVCHASCRPSAERVKKKHMQKSGFCAKFRPAALTTCRNFRHVTGNPTTCQMENFGRCVTVTGACRIDRNCTVVEVVGDSLPYTAAVNSGRCIARCGRVACS
jgi:hypothetical protein